MAQCCENEMSADKMGRKLFLVTESSPNRQIVICEYMDGEINRMGSYGNKFLNQSMGPLELSLGDFDGDRMEDVFILSNGQKPEGYFVFADGVEEIADLDNYPRLQLLYSMGVDFNLDGVDDLFMVSRTGGLMSNIWDRPHGSDEKTINTHIKSIRKRLHEIDEMSDPIETHRGIGYSLIE